LRHVSSPHCNPRLCDDLTSLSKSMKTCQVCTYEGRGRTYRGVNYCYKHATRACTAVHKDPSQQTELRLGGLYKKIKVPSGMMYDSWLCPYPELTCWEKMHLFYMQRDLFTLTEVDGELPMVKINRISSLYKARRDFIELCQKELAPASPSAKSSDHSMVVVPHRISPRRALVSKATMGRVHCIGVVSSPQYKEADDT
jgi:hypothetical protein